MTDTRPDPDELLSMVKQEESKEKRGRLKIFFGAAPGVGKTYTMLQDAALRRVEGLDVIIGIVESHGRTETEKLLAGFAVLPRLSIPYHNTTLSEFDLDQALQRHPALILVDEMAHTNADGCRHTKRWQDIKELLERGIDVYTTLNVQHIESLNDIVAQITNIKVRETVPDSILELANTIELIDLPPDDLLKRLEEGKVYFPEQAKLAIDSFFRKANLVALRELALRFTAELVNTEVLLQRKSQSAEKIWPTSERLLVCVGPGEGSAKLIRAAKRMATRLQAEWIAVSVEAPRLHISETERESILQNLRLAEQLGAETMTLTGRDVVKEIMAYANNSNINKIILGKQIRPRWKDLLFGSLVDELVRHSGDIDIYIIRGEDWDRSKTDKPLKNSKKFYWQAYSIATAYVFIATLINFLLYNHLGNSNLIMVYLLTVIAVAMRGQRGPSIWGSCLSVILYDFFFIPPRFSFAVADTQYLITLIVMMIVAQVISHLTLIIQEQAVISRAREQRSAELHALSKQLASHRGLNSLLTIATQHLAKLFNSQIFILLPDTHQHLQVRAVYHFQHPHHTQLSEKEKSVAQWSYDLAQMAGLGTQTLPLSEALYLPLKGSQVKVGVLGIKPEETKLLTNTEQLRLLEACVSQIALALEVDHLQEESRQVQAEMDNERLRSALLSSVSHDLRTPLAAIMGSASSLNSITTGNAQELSQTIYSESERLDHLISNLLQTVSLEGGKVELHKQLYALEETIGVALNHLEKILLDRVVEITLPNALPMIYVDEILIEQVFINLLENAARYTPLNTIIKISAEVKADAILIKIIDQGDSLSANELDKIFDKFYRGTNSKGISGTGLGLAICASIIKAHGGKIWAEKGIQGGALFCFTLPL